MGWADTLGGLIDRYASGSGGTAPAREDVHQDFQQAAQAAPKEAVASGISQAFRSDQTPPFAEMVAHLFGNSDGNQRAGLLNQLLGSLGPGAAGSLPGLESLAGLLSGASITPQQANQVSPDQVREIASHAERRNPSVVDEVSSFYAQHPQAVKAMGGLALAIALQHMLKHR